MSCSTDKTKRPLVYLAVPYSDPDWQVRLKRFLAANRVAGRLIRKDLHVFSPISHTHPIAEASLLPRDFEFWEPFNRAYLSVSARLYVLMLEGWEESVGVQAEIKIAGEEGIPVEYLSASYADW